VTSDVYYNEYEPYAAQWLRNLIAAGHIAPGEVDERSIEDVHPDDLRGYTQCHFFAGVGVWSYALRRAGWPDDRPVWTGSCPCQPFSAAGKGLAFADERHLWPAFGHLIGKRKPPVVLGEQVASSPVDDWIDLVHADMEAMGYAFGSVPFPSAGVGAPHIRDRNYWCGVAQGDSIGKGLEKRIRESGFPKRARGAIQGQAVVGTGIQALRMDIAPGSGRQRIGQEPEYRQPGQAGKGNSGLPNAASYGREWRWAGQASDGRNAARVESERLCDASEQPGPTNGFWRDADWLGCTDGKWRPVEPGTFPLAHGATNRVGRLRAYGNAINAEAAKVWIETVMECMP
jgi:DNA (cytosine-5)-methyltransferase 1